MIDENRLMILGIGSTIGFFGEKKKEKMRKINETWSHKHNLPVE